MCALLNLNRHRTWQPESTERSNNVNAVYWALLVGTSVKTALVFCTFERCKRRWGCEDRVCS